MEDKKAKRERGRNFTEKEKEAVVEIIERYRPQLENKVTDATSHREKQAAWEKVIHECNATSQTAPRTVKQLKVLWANIKRTTKKSIAEENKKRYLETREEYDGEYVASLKRLKMDEKKERSKTGGGQCNTQLSDMDARILAMVEPQARPLCNIFDCDNVYHGDVVLSPTRGLIVVSPPTLPVHMDPVPGPSWRDESPPPYLPSPPSDQPLTPSAVAPEIPQPPKKVIRKKTRIVKSKKNTADLKRLLYLKRIKLAEMELNFKKRLYRIELEIKEKELEIKEKELEKLQS
ncbi:hypothetical protein Zmor_003636 [Zophobas morio]|uniref:Regulatory protein zeste n=1 Tax=Zophobas morio TaxID=2755281 RepID=A0AA38M276_9CUCU|nr:hypothetical protein Zmor_003636 [Zophobas morio]